MSQSSLALLNEPAVHDGKLDKLFRKLDDQDKCTEQSLRAELKSIGGNVRESSARLGLVLAGYKALCSHGEWLPFCQIIGIPERTARRYMELGGIRKDLDGRGLTQLLESAGITVGTGNNKTSDENRQIARVLNELAGKRLTEKANRSRGTDISLSEDEQAQIVQQAIDQVRPSKVSFNPSDAPGEDPAVIRMRLIDVMGTRLSEALVQLREAWNDDMSWQKDVSQRVTAVLNGK